MDFNIKFYKEDERWYADIPEVSKEDCEMVMGADTLLEKFSLGFFEVNVNFSTHEPQRYLYKYDLVEHDEFGGTYQNNDTQFWLCNVTHYICNEHPSELFITEIKYF